MEGSVIYPKLESLGVYRISAQLFRRRPQPIVELLSREATPHGASWGAPFGQALRGPSAALQLVAIDSLFLLTAPCIWPPQHRLNPS